MNLQMPVPMELQLQLHQHQQMLLRQHQLALRRHLPDPVQSANGWPHLIPGNGPALPSDVKVGLQNQKLWQQFHAETTEMIITKSGRRMFPSVQLTVDGLERRARYCVLLEVAPASPRRHKYVGAGGGGVGVEESGHGGGKSRGWTSAGPAEPQPRIDRRIYLHPDSPATGAHWMQHPVSFSKLKLTNNAVDHKNNVVLTSMHKYIPRIWIIRCDDLGSLNNLGSHPASSFAFDETAFIAVTAYQNENITKLKIDNNPFAKGFRETGQSRCKRKFHQTESDRSHRTDDEEGNLSSSESESNRASSSESPAQRPKTASSESSGSLDDSGASSYGGVSPPLPSNRDRERDREQERERERERDREQEREQERDQHRPENARIECEREVQPRLHRPWADSPPPVQQPSCSSSSSSSSSPSSFSPSLTLSTTTENLHFVSAMHDPGLPAYYFRMFHPSFAIQPDFARLHHYQPPLARLSKYH